MRLIFALGLLITITACQNTQLDTVNQHSKGSSGLASDRLNRIVPAMQKYIDQGKLAGTVTLVARNGKIAHLQAQGYQDKATAKPITTDTIFRIYSMTKPITAVAALTLWEQGLFHMFDPVEKYLPEFANMQVYVSGSGADMITQKAKQPIRIIDLFTHTSGLSYGFTNSEVDKLYQQLFANRDSITRENFLTKLTAIPLVHQPGTAWNYGYSTDIIGFLVEKLSGQKLGDYMQEHIFTPLNMQDTGFYVSPSKANRFSEVYTANKQGQTVLMESEPLGDYLTDPEIHNGGGGLTSTILDYYKFSQMLLNGGELNGTRILGRKTVEYMRTNHMPKDLMPYSKDAQGEGFALAMSVTVAPDEMGFMSSKGNYGWAGLASTYFRIDPKENMILISMAQFIPSGFHAYQDDFRNLTYQALVD